MHQIRFSRLARTVLVAGATSAALSAQTLLYTTHGTSGDQFGRSIAPAGDVNGDGYDDVIVGSPLDDPNGANSGKAVVYSGRTNNALFVFNGYAAGDEFGFSVAGIGDIDHDGHDDVAIGAPGRDAVGSNSGSVLAYSGANGALLHNWAGNELGAYFGHAVAGAGDVDADGYADVIVGVPFEDVPATDAGAVRIFSGHTGAQLLVVNSVDYGANYGWSVAGVGDVNGDGHADFIAGAPEAENSYTWVTGRATVTSGADGSHIKTVYGVKAGHKMGWSVAGLGDVDGDGVPDYAAGAPYSDADAFNGGEVKVLSGATGFQLYKKTGGVTGWLFGSSVAGVGDVDDDGHADFMVGIPGYGYFGIDDTGLAQVLSGASGDPIHSFLGSAGDQLGIAVSGAGDVNDDGTPDVVIAAPYADSNGTNSGYVRTVLMDAPWPTAYGTAKTNSLGCVPHITATGVPSLHTANNFHIKATDVRNNKAGMLFWSLSSANFPFHGGTLLVGAPFMRTSAQDSGGSASGNDCSGHYDFFFSQSYMSSVTLIPGQTVKAQYWSRDPGFAYPNNVGLTNALAFEVLN